MRPFVGRIPDVGTLTIEGSKHCPHLDGGGYLKAIGELCSKSFRNKIE